MLTLTLNNEILPLPLDFTMRLTWKSPMCNFEKIPSGYGLGLSFPINEYTRVIFGRPERYAKRRVGNDQKFSGFEVRFSGVLLMSGTLQVVSATGGNYEANLIDQVGVLGEKEQERSILDFVSFSKEIPWENKIFTAENSPYGCFPVNNTHFFKDKGVVIDRSDLYSDPTDGGKIKTRSYEIELLRYLHQITGKGQVNCKAEDGTIKAIASTIDGTVLKQKGNTYDTGVVTVVSPFFFLNWVIKQALKENLFFVGRNYLDEDVDLKNVCIYNNFDLTKLSFAKTGTIFWELVDKAKNDLIGRDSEGISINKYFRAYPSTFQPKNHLPKMKLGELLVGAQNLFNLCFHFLPNNTVQVYSRQSMLESESIDLNPFMFGDWAIGEKNNLALKFVREHDLQDQVFSEGYTDLTDRLADLKPAVDTWEQLVAITDPEEGNIRYIKSGQQYAEYKWYTPETIDETVKSYTTTDVLGWKVISIGFQNGWFEYGREDQEEIKTAFSTCFGYNTMVSVIQPGNMNSWKAKQQAFSPRLLIYRGNNTGGIESETLSLDYGKAGIGILDKYWKHWNLFWANRLPVTGVFDMPVNVLRHVAYNICSKFRTCDGEFLIEEMSCELFIDRIGSTEIKGFKVD